MAAAWRGRRACSHVSGIGIPHTVLPPLIDRAVSFGLSARSRNERQMYIKHMKNKFCMIEQSPESMAAARRWNTRKLLSALCDLYILYTFIYFLCSFMNYTFCSTHFELKCIQKVRIFVHFLYSTWSAWVRFVIYTFCIHLYTFCIASMLPTLIWNRILYKKYTSQKVCRLHHNCFGFNVIYIYIQNIDCNLLNQHNNCIQKLYKVYTCCIWLVLICTWICDFYIRVHFKNVEYKLQGSKLFF